MKKASLSIEAAEHVQELLASREAFGALLKVIRSEVTAMEGEVIRMSSAQGAEAIFQSKLRAEGARKLLKALEQLVAQKTK